MVMLWWRAGLNAHAALAVVDLWPWAMADAWLRLGRAARTPR